MVAQHYRWDFIGLSTDQKPTPATSEKVVDGSTFYCSDNSKLYVYCKNNWYERKALGGGGGTTYTAGTGIDITEGAISIDEEVVATLEELNARIAKGEGVPTTATEGVVGGLYEDNTNGKLYICTAITAGTDPDPDTYTWEEVGGGGGVTVAQTTGTSTTDVMSQDATTKLIYPDIANKSDGILIGSGTLNGNHNIAINGQINAPANRLYNIAISPYSSSPATIGDTNQGTSIAIGYDALCNTGTTSIAIGRGAIANASSNSGSCIAIGYSTNTGGKDQTVALGAYARCSRNGEVNVGTGFETTKGFNSTNYRVIGGVHDGQDAHDVATVAQGNTLATSAPDTSTVGVLGQLYTDTTNMHTYQCTAISGSTYTWTQRW